MVGARHFDKFHIITASGYEKQADAPPAHQARRIIIAAPGDIGSEDDWRARDGGSSSKAAVEELVSASRRVCIYAGQKSKSRIILCDSTREGCLHEMQQAVYSAKVSVFC